MKNLTCTGLTARVGPAMLRFSRSAAPRAARVTCTPVGSRNEKARGRDNR